MWNTNILNQGQSHLLFLSEELYMVQENYLPLQHELWTCKWINRYLWCGSRSFERIEKIMKCLYQFESEVSPDQRSFLLKLTHWLCCDFLKYEPKASFSSIMLVPCSNLLRFLLCSRNQQQNSLWNFEKCHKIHE